MARTESRLLGITTAQEVWWSERAEVEVGLQVAGLLVAGLLVVEICGLATTHLDSMAPSIEDSGMSSAAFSCFSLTRGLYQPIPAPAVVAIGTAIANSSWCAVRRSQWPVGAFFRNGMFFYERG